MKKHNEFHDLLLESKNKHSNELASFILKAVGIFYQVEEDYYVMKTRKREIIEARQMSMYMIRRHTDLTLKKIAKFYERDHATVLHSIKKIEDYKFYDKHVRREIKDIEYMIKYRASALKENADWRKEYFFVDLNNIYSFTFSEDKAIILSGYDDQSMEKLKNSFIGLKSVRKHDKTGMYILEKIKKPEENE